MSKPYLSIVIPCFEEIRNLRKGVLDKVDSFLSHKKISYEVIIVDDGSTDGSQEFIKNFAKTHKEFRLIENPHLGKAGAVTTGVLASEGEYVLFTDMDQATPIEEIDNLMPYFKEGYKIVIGSRNRDRKGSPLFRIIMARANMILRSIIVGLKGITDTQCGFKIFEHAAAHKLFKKVYDLHNGFKVVKGSSVQPGFDVELLYLAQIEGYKIKEVPVAWLYVETRRVSPIRDSIFGLRDLLVIKKNALMGKYK
jgi:glycosyltransferase involved in cell wall biosynthesis